MKNIFTLMIGIVGGILLMIALLGLGSIQAAQAGQPGDSIGATPSPFSLLPADSKDEVLPPVMDLVDGIPSVNALATPVPGETLLYFVPSDNDATGTVLYLYNTDSVVHTVALRGYNYDGAMVYAQNISVPALSFRRLVSDSVAAAPPPSWATPAPVTTNFTDFTYLASLSLPKGVKAEGYVLFNPGTGVVDPRTDQGAIPLRFSTDPAAVFLPSIQNP